ncbi:hypothetical protein BCF11_1280 [Collimonas sp. PA-H2]|uniref:hypothetical protein n=1 Tax=Collimonas sp. PA-H2 TaxID=1881062 RepID=UPI000C01677B|nr:hypothetical protein [Collimonas sp. PA-H2]PFH08903.1 hypothetical protein BCF11_1280 [Collimonas sp. PA-H2]
MHTNIFVTIGLLLLTVTDVATGANSLCKKNEEVYFSCATNGGKIISLCGEVFDSDKDKFGNPIELDSPWLQYRFGSPGKIELSYPRQKKNSLERFKAQRIRAQGGDIRLDAIVFASAGIGYSVEHAVPDTQEIIEGVSVGDPRDFDIEALDKSRKKYPQSRIDCAEQADTKNFFDLVDDLAK